MRKLLLILLLLTPPSLIFANNGVPLSTADFEVQNPAIENISTGNLTTAHFVLHHDINPLHAKTVAYLMEFSYHNFLTFHNMLGFDLRQPEKKLNWVCFSEPDDFSNYSLTVDKMDLSWLSGYYSARTNAVAIIEPHPIPDWTNFKNQTTSLTEEYANGYNTPLVQIIHEAAHQLAFNTGLQKKGVMYPIWAGEGPALIFEDSLSQCFPTIRYSTLRLDHLARLHQQNKLIPIRQFITLSRLPADAAEQDIYAQALAFYAFLFENHTEEVKQYFQALYGLKTGPRSDSTMLNEFTNAFGPLDLIEKQWVLHLLSTDDQP